MAHLFSARRCMTAIVMLIALARNAGAIVTLDMVTVGDLGNAKDSTGFGSVSYEYQIGKYEVTIGQYAEFLNAVAKTDQHGLYSPSMGSDKNIAGIARSGSSGAYVYEVQGPFGYIPPIGADSPGDRPISYVSWLNAARFANWMTNGQGTDGTETGAYTLTVKPAAGSGVAVAQGQKAILYCDGTNVVAATASVTTPLAVAAVATAGIPRWRVWPAVMAAPAVLAAMRRAARPVTAVRVVSVATASVVRPSPGWTVPLLVMVALVAPVLAVVPVLPPAPMALVATVVTAALAVTPLVQLAAAWVALVAAVALEPWEAPALAAAAALAVR